MHTHHRPPPGPAHLHLGLLVEPGDNGIEARPEAQVVQRLVLLADRVLGVDAGALGIACGGSGRWRAAECGGGKSSSEAD